MHESFFFVSLRSFPIVLSNLHLDDRPLQLTVMIFGGPGLDSMFPRSKRKNLTLARDSIEVLLKSMLFINFA